MAPETGGWLVSDVEAKSDKARPPAGGLCPSTGRRSPHIQLAIRLRLSIGTESLKGLEMLLKPGHHIIPRLERLFLVVALASVIVKGVVDAWINFDLVGNAGSL